MLKWIVTKRLKQAEEDVILVEGKHPAIISRETWEEAKATAAKNPPVTTSTELRNPYSGILHCAKCGYSMRLRPYKHAESRLHCCEHPMCYKSVKYTAFTDAVIFALEQSELPALELHLQNNDGNAAEIQRKQIAKLEKQMEEYSILFNTITDVIEELKLLEKKLMEAQQKAEEIYMEK